MIGVDYGSSSVKWFNGKEFGTGIPEGKSFTLGLSSSELLVRESFYPLCAGAKLKKLIINDVSTDLSVPPEEISVAFCRKEKLEKGCRFLVFVEKRKSLEELPQEIASRAQITVDLLGGVTAALTLSENFTLLDAGKRKIALVRVENGKISEVEILRGGFEYHTNSGELVSVLKGNEKNVILVGGGAFSDRFREELSKITDFSVPEFPPFGKETPIYFNAYGLYSFKKSPCKAFFKSFSSLSQELLKEKGKIIFLGTVTGLALLILTGGLFLSYLSAKKDYYAAKREITGELSKLLGEKVLAPEIQIPQELEKYKKLAEFFRIGSPSLLYYLNGISKSVTKGVTVFSLDGSLSSGQFTVKGRAEDEKSLKSFIENLKKYFKKVAVSSTKENKSGINFTVRAGVGSGD